ncbi:MAG: SCO family protein [Betaproteobacteria bacterium]|nr:MAG: SCO family protein [Betaproteobacteria bacterium]
MRRCVMGFVLFAGTALAGFAVLAAENGHRHHGGHEQHAGHQQNDADEHAAHQKTGGDDPHAKHRAQAATAAAAPSSARVTLHDRALVDRHGQRVRLVSDVLSDRVAVINFVYTTCTTVCPVTSATFAQLQSELGERLGKEVVLVSISVDPVRDTPPRLKQYSAMHGAGDHWLWLTGAKPDVDQVLRGMGAYTPNFQDHPAMVLVGDASRNEWSRYFGFPSAQQLLASINAIGGSMHDKAVVKSKE